MGSKFFVYGDGRWRELDTESGTLAGWGRVPFVYQAGGRLAIGRRRCVLRALRALAAGRGRAARDGLQLSKHTPYPEHGIRHRLDSPQPHWQHRSHRTRPPQTCSQCDNYAKFDQLRESQCTVGVQCVPTVEAAVQVSQVSRGDRAAEAARVAPQAAPRGRTSDGVQLISTQSSLLYPRNKRGQFVKNRSHLAKYVERDKYLQMTNSDKIKLATEEQKPQPVSVEESYDSESPKSKSIDSLSTKNTNKADVELVINEEDVELLLRFLKNNNLGVDLERFENDEQYKAHVFYSINPLVLVERSAPIASMLRKERGDASRLPLKSFMTMLGLQTVGERRAPRARYSTRARAAQPPPAGDDKENEAERLAARSPLARIAKVLREDNRASNRVRGARPPPSKRPRKNLQRSTGVIEIHDSSSEHSSGSRSGSKVNDTKTKMTEKKKELQISKVRTSSSERYVVDTRKRGDVNGKRQLGTDDTKRNRGSDDVKQQLETDDTKRNHGSDDVKQQLGTDDTKRKRPVVRNIGGSVESGGGSKKNREYSVQEDIAIVSWLRQGGRACLVKGNRLWRDMQQEHATRTGIVRSWHSLRNRYLRYILPILPRLTSQQEAMRLRAAASDGELKSRKQTRENSMLALKPVCGAWTRRRVAALSDSPASSPATSPEPAPRASTPKPAESTRLALTRSPTYSQVTRRFGRAPTSSSEEFVSVKEPAAAKDRSLRPRTSPARGCTQRAAPVKRRLYNPKVAA